MGVRLNEFVAVLVPIFQNFLAHQIGVEDRDFIEGQVVKKDLRIFDLFGFRQIGSLRKLTPELIQHQFGQDT